MKFKANHNFEDRKKESDKIMNKYPSRIPIIVEKAYKCNLNDIDKQKYLAPKDLKMNQFLYVIRKRIQLTPSESIFLMANNQLCPSNSSLIDIYERAADEDGFLYITYTSENTFG
tara:strand:- start:639 stop:983 length:345 start_codon:yes stop_codon:yes gene_type:complete